MRQFRCLSVILMVTLILPHTLIAAEQNQHSYTPKDQINFAPATITAFDYSGKLVTQRRLADGSVMADHNGSMGDIAIARLGPDGKIEIFFATDIVAAKAWMAGEIGTKPVTTLSVTVMEK